jgi:hypothetical protein
MHRIIYIISVFVLCFSSVPSFAEMYRWVDEEGVQHFSDAPPESGVVGEVEKAPEIPYDAKADEARNAHDKKVMDEIMSQESQSIAAAGTEPPEGSASSTSVPEPDAGEEVVYEGDGGGPRTDVLGINDRAENAPERRKERHEAEERREHGETRPHTEHSDDVLGINEASENQGAREAAGQHRGGHRGK